MRPSLLDPLFAPATALPGIGPKNARLIDKLVGEAGREARALDLLFHLPSGFVDRRQRPKIVDAPIDSVVTIRAQVTEHRPPATKRGRAPYRVIVEDETGDLMLVFFLANHIWIEKSLPIGATRWISGKIELWDGHRQMVHPDKVLDEAGLARLAPVEPVYPMTDGLYPRVLTQGIEGALKRLPPLAEWLDPALVSERQWPAFGAALTALHQPQQPEVLDPLSPAFQRLAYDEILANQLALALVRATMRRPQGTARTGDGRISGRIESALPYKLTGAQQRALADIRADMASDKRMLRLLQGDVGSGKTIVALLAMASVVEAGHQAALMAPTEILARQHAERIIPMAQAAGLRAALMTGRDKAGERRTTLAALASGEIDILIGTHALFQEEVQFSDLGLAIVDEQHRFGVHQRLALGSKGEAVDVLVMTATPIPRTLVLTFFGDMEASNLDEKPPGRQPIDTRAVSMERLDEVIAGIRRAIGTGARVYWVCPLVSESEASDLSAAADRHDDLSRIFGPQAVGLVHGQMKGKDRDAAMEAFQQGRTQILVATTVIEVGVDVPEATIMVIEHAERFGLAQLHQLRGRVGRGSGKSTCLLLYKGPLSQTAEARLSIMRESEDGFRIAEEDLKLRGEGEVLGARQSGLPGFRMARPEVHGDLIPVARQDARLILEKDAALATPRGQALRHLLYLFGRDEAARLIRAG